MDRRQGEAGRRDARAQPGPLFDALPDPAVAYVGNGQPRVADVNRAYVECFGEATLSPGDPIEAALSPGRLLEGDVESLESAVDAGESRRIGVLATAAEERPRYRVRTLALDGAAALDGVVQFCPEAGTAREETLRTFARVVSHDVQNPLEVARIRLDAAEETADPEHFEKVRWAHDRIRQLSRDVLFLTDAEAAIDPDPVALGGLVAPAWEPVDAPSATVETGDLPTILADEDALLRLLTNLFRNAVEHGGPDVTVRVEGRADGFVVADDGPGFPADLDRRVLEPGVSGGEGTGLGLAVVARVAEAHGWSVELSTSAAGGAAVGLRDVDTVAASADGE